MDRIVKLYIDGSLVDIDNSINISLNKTIVDFSNQSKRNSPFTYTLKLPLSKNNKVIFKHIDYIHTTNKFTKTESYKAQMFINGQLVLEGSYILRLIVGNYYEGNMIGEIRGLQLDFVDKTLQDLGLPEIDFEGVMIPYESHHNVYNVLTFGQTRYAYATASSYCLNKNLAFDLQSLILGFKNPYLGLLNSTIDYTNYYKTGLVAYSNFSSLKSGMPRNALSNEVGINNFMPQIIYNKVISQIFIDMGYVVNFNDVLLSDDDLLFPYFGNTEPEWNWLQLSKCFIYSDRNRLSPITYHPQTNKMLDPPLLNSRYGKNIYTLSLEETPIGRHIKTVPNEYKQFTDKIGFNKYFDTDTNPDTASFSATHSFLCVEDITNEVITKFSFMLTNGVKYDFLNNFSVFSSPTTKENPKFGQVYTVPADGEYEFDLDITHNITTYNYISRHKQKWKDNYLFGRRDWKKSGTIDGYDGGNPTNNTWMYNGMEQFYAGNMVCFVKDDIFGIDGSSIADKYQNQFQYGVADESTIDYKSARLITNFKDDGVIAYYNPMLRDLYTGGHRLCWEDYITAEKSILVNPNPIPTGSDIDNLIYQGFNADTTIEQYTNEIGYDTIGYDPDFAGYDDLYSRTEQYKRKLVRTKKIWGATYSPMPNGVGRSIAFEPHLFGVTPIPQNSVANYATGNVKFKFKSKLKKGDQIRMVYCTVDQFKKYGTGAFWMDHLLDIPLSPGLYDYSTDPSVRYNDLYNDEYVINSYKIKCVSDDLYSSKLKLANFLPKLKVKDVFDDFIKSNNIYFSLEGNRIIFKKRDDYFKNESIDLTNNVDPTTFQISAVGGDSKFKRNIQYGLNIKQGYDFLPDVNNPTINLNNAKTIYDDKDLLDLTSKLFFTSANKNYNFRVYNINYGNGFHQTNNADADLHSSMTFSIPSFQDGGDSNTLPSESNPNYSRNNYLVRHLGYTDLFPDATIRSFIDVHPDQHLELAYRDIEWLVNGIPFYNICPGLVTSYDGYLDNRNRAYQWVDRFSSSDDICQVEALFYLTTSDYNKIDPTKAVVINNTTYYISKIENFNPLKNGLTKIILIKI